MKKIKQPNGNGKSKLRSKQSTKASQERDLVQGENILDFLKKLENDKKLESKSGKRELKQNTMVVTGIS